MEHVHDDDFWWTIRVSRGYRALARKVEGIFIWFWIGTPDEYVRRI